MSEPVHSMQGATTESAHITVADQANLAEPYVGLTRGQEKDRGRYLYLDNTGDQADTDEDGA